MNCRHVLLWASLGSAFLLLLLLLRRSAVPGGARVVAWARLREIARDVASQRLAEDEVVLWPGGAPGEAEHPAREEVQQHVENRPWGYPDLRLRQVSRPTLVPYLVKGSRGAVIVAPGGGYTWVSYISEGVDVAERLNAMGVSAFVLKYRVPLRPPADDLPFAWAQLQDAQRAMGIVRGRAAEWGIDTHKIGFMGFSAGGHLTAHLSTSWQSRIYKAVDAYDAISCRPDVSFLIYPWRLNGPKGGRRLAPELNVSKTTPPAFIATAVDDGIARADGSQQYWRKLWDHGVTASLQIYPSGNHAFALCQHAPARVAKAQDSCTWPVAAQRLMQQMGIAPELP